MNNMTAWKIKHNDCLIWCMFKYDLNLLAKQKNMLWKQIFDVAEESFDFTKTFFV